MNLGIKRVRLREHRLFRRFFLTTLFSQKLQTKKNSLNGLTKQLTLHLKSFVRLWLIILKQAVTNKGANNHAKNTQKGADNAIICTRNYDKTMLLFTELN